jgi:hypothetical protein
MIISREKLLQAKAVETRDVDLGNGEFVRVRGLSGKERDALEASTIQGKGKNKDVNLSNFRAKLCVRAIIDADGKRLFKDDEVALLGEISAKVISKIYDAAAELSGLSEADVDELTKNSESDQSDDSGSN